MSESDHGELGSPEIPDVLVTLAGVLHQFQGDDLEAQLQTYDMFLGMLAPSVRPRIADLLREAAGRAPTAEVRERIEAAATNVATGGRAAEPYDHAKAMQAYTEEFLQSYPADTASPEGEKTAAPAAKRVHPLLLAQLDQIEAELKRIGRWADHPPDLMAAVDRGEIKSYLDAPTFELWLQGIFLIRARQACHDDKLPDSSSVGEMARRQYDYMSIDHEAEPLLHLLQRFDELVELASQNRA